MRLARAAPRSATSRSTTLVLLANILDAAVEYELLPSNPARGKRRRLKAARPTRRFLEADELAELLAAAAELDSAARSDRRIGRQPMIAVMAKSGLRVSEVCQLRWRSVDVHHQRLVVEQSKTDAGVREVDLSLDLGRRAAELAGAVHAGRRRRVRIPHRRRPLAGQGQRSRAGPRAGRQAAARDQSRPRSSAAAEDHAARAAADVHQPDARVRRPAPVRDGPGRPPRLQVDA